MQQVYLHYVYACIMYGNTLKYGAFTACTYSKMCAHRRKIRHTGWRVHPYVLL